MVSDIESLMSHVRPSVEAIVKRSLVQTLVNMIACHRNDTAELEQIESQLGSEEYGSW